MSKGIIYIFTNPVMPDIIKIGMTENEYVKERCAQLYRGSTGVPVPFKIYYAAYVPNMEKTEKALHEGFAEHRINPKREFFRMNPELVIAMLQMVDPKPIDLSKENKIETEEDKEEENILESIKEPINIFRYSMIGLKEGDELVFIRDQNIKAKVLEKNPTMTKFGNWIEYQGEVYSLSSLAAKLLNIKYSVNGTLYWLYNGKTLFDLKKEKEINEIKEED